MVSCEMKSIEYNYRITKMDHIPRKLCIIDDR